MNWEKKISGIRNPEIKRIRKVQASFTASFSDKEVSLDAPIPQDTGYCLRPLLRDYLYVYGKTTTGREKRISCGLFSSELLKQVTEHIRTK